MIKKKEKKNKLHKSRKEKESWHEVLQLFTKLNQLLRTPADDSVTLIALLCAIIENLKSLQGGPVSFKSLKNYLNPHFQQ